MPCVCAFNKLIGLHLIFVVTILNILEMKSNYQALFVSVFFHTGGDALRRRPSFDPDLHIPKELTLTHQNEILKQVIQRSCKPA